MASLARVTHLSTQTLTLLVERQRLETLGQAAPATSTAQVVRNLNAMRNGIAQLENAGGPATDATRLLRNQFERMRLMLGSESSSVEPLAPLPTPAAPSPRAVSPASPASVSRDSFSLPARPYAPYRDSVDDDGGYSDSKLPRASPNPFDGPRVEDEDPQDVLAYQRQAMMEQDTQLDSLGDSIRRQRDISLRIGDELEVHTGLLESLDSEVDATTNRMAGARRRLDNVAQGAKRNVSAITIGALIFILLILIIVFKT